MNHPPRKPISGVKLDVDALDRIAVTLSDLYRTLYEERPVSSQASLTGNMLAFVIDDGLSVADEWLLRHDRGDLLKDFREHFFEVVDDQMTEVIADLTGLSVTYSFYGFDPTTRTTHAIFVLDLSPLNRAEERQAVLNWGEQVRRNARRLRQEHVATREAYKDLKVQVQAHRDRLRREIEGDGEPSGRSGVWSAEVPHQDDRAE
jgi:uncharacterized protein YbcI